MRKVELLPTWDCEAGYSPVGYPFQLSCITNILWGAEFCYKWLMNELMNGELLNYTLDQ